jgi:aspartate aminotransferase
MKSLSTRALGLAPSMTVQIDSLYQRLKAGGRPVISLGVGEPDFPMPRFAASAMRQAIDEGRTRYGAAGGLADFRAAVTQKLFRENELRYAPEQIVATSGAKHAVFNALMALVNPGDEVIVPSPYWVTYPEIVRFLGGVPVFVKCQAKDNFHLNPDDLLGAITPKTKCVVLNNPCNPTGAVLSKNELRAIAQVIAQHDLWCVSDEIYEHFVYEGNFTSLASLPYMQERTILVNGLAKSHCMTGVRIGYLAAPPEAARAIAKIQGQTTHHPSTISQYGAIAALNDLTRFVPQMRAAFLERRNYLVERLQKIAGVQVRMPEGAFYVFSQVDSLFREGRSNSTEFCQKLLQDNGLALVPGAAFGDDACVRWSYAASMDTIEEALKRFREFV